MSAEIKPQHGQQDGQQDANGHMPFSLYESGSSSGDEGDDHVTNTRPRKRVRFAADTNGEPRSAAEQVSAAQNKSMGGIESTEGLEDYDAEMEEFERDIAQFTSTTQVLSDQQANMNVNAHNTVGDNNTPQEEKEEDEDEDENDGDGEAGNERNEEQLAELGQKRDEYVQSQLEQQIENLKRRLTDKTNAIE